MTVGDCSLGCGDDYSVFVTGRGGTSTVAVLEPSSIGWGRSLDSVSMASVTVSSECCDDILASLQTWHHELLITRGSESVWQGPIVNLVYTPDTLELSAWDVLGYLGRRGIPQPLNYTSTGLGAADLTEIARALIDDAFSVDDPNVLAYLTVSPSGIVGERSYTVDEPNYTLDNLSELARTGIDYTVIGRRIILTGETPTSQLRALAGQDFVGDLKIVGDGLSQATSAVIIGTGVVGRAGGVDPYYGLVEVRVREESILDQPSADAAAQARVSAGNPMPVIIDPSSASQLDPEAPVCINQLVPGVAIPVQVNTEYSCRPISTTMRLLGLDVKADNNGEKVNVKLAPLVTLEG